MISRGILIVRVSDSMVVFPLCIALEAMAEAGAREPEQSSLLVHPYVLEEHSQSRIYLDLHPGQCGLAYIPAAIPSTNYFLI